MRLTPFRAVDGVLFTASPEDVLRSHGTPSRRHRNGIGLTEYDYGSVVFRFQDSGRLEEVTAQAPVLHLGPVAVPFDALEGFVRAHDPSAFDRAGFLVSPVFGLAFSPDVPAWVTALAAHCIAEWRAL
jgi:hypothetical protein